MVQGKAAEPARTEDESEADMMRLMDERENSEVELPEDEQIDVMAGWVAECYTPSMIDDLLQSMELLGWDTSDDSMFGWRTNPVEWIEQQRRVARGGGMFPVHLLVREQDRGQFFGPKLVAPLPDGVERASAAIVHAFTGLFVIVMQFRFGPGHSARVRQELEKHFVTRIKPLPNGKTFVGPTTQRAEAVRAARQSALDGLATWMRDWLPGAFAETGSVASFPTGELVACELAKPFSSDYRFKTFGHYLEVLGFARGFDVWQSHRYKGVFLRLPRSEDHRPFSVVMAGNRSEMFSEGDLDAYGGSNREGITRYSQYLHTTFSKWALHSLLSVWEGRLTALREQPLGAPGSSISESRIYEAFKLEQDLLRLGSEASSVVLEMQDYLGSQGMYEFELYQFWELSARRGHTEARGTSSLILDALGRALVLRADDRNPDDELFESLRQGMLARCAWILRTESQLRQFAKAQSSLVAAKSQQGLAQSNLGLQRLLFWLSVIVFVLAAVQTAIAALTFLDDADRPSTVPTTTHRQGPTGAPPTSLPGVPSDGPSPPTVNGAVSPTSGTPVALCPENRVRC